MNALDSRTIRTIIVAMLGYAVVRFGLPDQFASDAVKSAIADLIVYAGFALAAYYRKHAQADIRKWWGKDAG
jgi:hypothetical protein